MSAPFKTAPDFRWRSSFEWHQSSVTLMLRCPRQFFLKNVVGLPPSHRANNYAHFLGTADHGGAEFILHQANEGRTPERGEVLDVVMEHFQGALYRAQDNGEDTDPEGLERACDRLENERLDRLMALANDPRIRAIEWRGIEWPFQFTNRGVDSHGRAWRRKWKGTLDAWGVARHFVRDFGAEGREPVHVSRGDGILADWKSGLLATTPVGVTELRASVQLGIYAMALNRKHPASWRTFLGLLVDLDKPKAPTDDEGKRIPKWLPEAMNPAFLAAMEERGVSAKDAEKTRKRAKDAEGNPIPKRLPQAPNPEFEAAVARPKGPLFREARVVYPLVVETVTAAIRQAEAGLFPASGALSGQCRMCPFSSVCTREEDQEEGDFNE